MLQYGYTPATLPKDVASCCSLEGKSEDGPVVYPAERERERERERRIERKGGKSEWSAFDSRLRGD